MGVTSTIMESSESTEQFKASPIRPHSVHETLSSPYPDGFSISYATNPTNNKITIATEADVDKWELKASRRALANIKALLHGQPMLDQLSAQCEEGDRYFKSVLAVSEGRWEECVTDLHVSGMKVAEVMSFRKQLLRLSRDEMATRFLLHIHPEHYAIPPYESEGIIEVIGEHMARLRIEPTENVPAFVMEFGNDTFPMKKLTIAKLDDGTEVFYILHEFRDTDEGCLLRLRLIFPTSAPQVFFDEHAEHLAIEFRSGVRLAYDNLLRERSQELESTQ